MLYVRGYEGRGYPEMAIGKRSVHGAALVLLLVVCVAARAVSAVGDGESPSTEADALLLVPRCVTD